MWQQFLTCIALFYITAVPYGASMVNGIRDEMVAGKPDFKQVLREFLDFAGEDVLVGHNIRSFDMKFLYRDALAYWGAVPDNDFVDTLPLSRTLLPELRHHSLGDLAAHYRISTLGAHRALADCYMNQKVFAALKQEQLPAAAFCPRCGQPLKKRNGRFGPFFGCSGYPDCRFTRNCEP